VHCSHTHLVRNYSVGNFSITTRTRVGSGSGSKLDESFSILRGVYRVASLPRLLEDTMGPAVVLKSGGSLYPSSIDMNVSFLAAAKAGPLVCEPEVLPLGKTVGFVQGTLMDPEERIVVRATSSVMLVPAERVG